MEAINNIVSGKNILITGGAAGLGHAFLNHFLKHGANVSVPHGGNRRSQKTVEIFLKINLAKRYPEFSLFRR